MLFSKGLAKRLGPRGLLAFSVHPGLIFSTQLAGHLDMSPDGDMASLAALDRQLGNAAGWITPEDVAKVQVSAEVGSATHVFASFEPSLTGMLKPTHVPSMNSINFFFSSPYRTQWEIPA